MKNEPTKTTVSNLFNGDKSALSLLILKKILSSFGIGLIAIGIGILLIVLLWPNGYTETEALVTDYVLGTGNYREVVLQYTVDGKEYTASVNDDGRIPTIPGVTATVYYNPENPAELSTHNGDYIVIAIGGIAVFLGVWVQVSAVASGARWFRRKKLDEEARSRTDTEAEADDAPLVSYTFSEESLEHLNDIMLDNTKKFAVVSQAVTDNYYMKDENGQTVISGRGGSCPAIFRSEYTINGTEKHTVRQALLLNGMTFSIGRSGTIRIDDLNSTDFVVDGKLFWNEFYRNGYYFDRDSDEIRSGYTFYKNGKELIHITGRKVQNADYADNNAADFLPNNGQYNVVCREKDLKLAWTLCYLMSTVESRH